jgi:pimeloyl-ACP methyl ester carboxylesterase
MRYFTRLLSELKELAARHKAGETLTPPSLLSSVKIHGRRVSYFHMGLRHKGPAIILLHGFGGFFMDWPRVMAPLARRHRVYALDLPGWGFSEPRDNTIGIEDDVGVIDEFIKHHQLEEVILVGISYGAAVSWAAAASKIPGLKKLVLLNPMPPFPLRHLKSPLYRAVFVLNSFALTARLGSRLMNKYQYKLICKENLKNHRLLDSLYLDIGYLVLKQPFVHQNLHIHSTKARSTDWKRWEDRVKEIDIPVTIMQGMDDRVFTIESARYLHGLIPGSKLIEVEDCGHAMVFDQHRKITAYLMQSLSTTQGDNPNVTP